MQSCLSPEQLYRACCGAIENYSSVTASLRRGRERRLRRRRPENQRYHHQDAKPGHHAGEAGDAEGMLSGGPHPWTRVMMEHEGCLGPDVPHALGAGLDVSANPEDGPPRARGRNSVKDRASRNSPARPPMKKPITRPRDWDAMRRPLSSGLPRHGHRHDDGDRDRHLGQAQLIEPAPDPRQQHGTVNPQRIAGRGRSPAFRAAASRGRRRRAHRRGPRRSQGQGDGRTDGDLRRPVEGIWNASVGILQRGT